MTDSKRSSAEGYREPTAWIFVFSQDLRPSNRPASISASKFGSSFFAVSNICVAAMAPSVYVGKYPKRPALYTKRKREKEYCGDVFVPQSYDMDNLYSFILDIRTSSVRPEDILPHRYQL